MEELTTHGASRVTVTNAQTQVGGPAAAVVDGEAANMDDTAKEGVAGKRNLPT